MTRKTPIRHKVRSHNRENAPVKSFSRGKGNNSQSQRRSRVVQRDPGGFTPTDASEKVTYRTPKQRFEFLSIDHILKSVTSNRQAVARLEILRERAEEEEVKKINKIISDIEEMNEELIEIKSSIEKRGEQPTFEPMGFKDTIELDRKTKTASLVTFTWAPLNQGRGFLTRAQGSMRNLRVRALEDKRTSEAGDIGSEIGKLTRIGAEISNTQDAIRELAAKIGEE